MNKDETTNKINIIEENISIDKEVVETGKVIIKSSIQETPFEQTVELNSTNYEIVRIPKDEFVNSKLEITETEHEKIIPVVEEVLVVEKRFKLVEEIHIIKNEQTINETIKDNLKKQVVNILKPKK